MATILGRAGQPVEGLTLLDQALAITAKSDGHFHEAELHRLKGELLLQQTVPDECRAESCFLLALDIARDQAAKAFELRAAMSQSRLWRQQGSPHKARNLLAPVYDWFAEGFDMADLQEAKSLLDDLDVDEPLPAAAPREPAN